MAQAMMGGVVEPVQQRSAQRRHGSRTRVVQRAPLQHFLEALEFHVGASRQTIGHLALNILRVGFAKLHTGSRPSENGDGAWPTVRISSETE